MLSWYWTSHSFLTSFQILLVNANLTDKHVALMSHCSLISFEKNCSVLTPCCCKVKFFSYLIALLNCGKVTDCILASVYIQIAVLTCSLNLGTQIFPTPALNFAYFHRDKFDKLNKGWWRMERKSEIQNVKTVQESIPKCGLPELVYIRTYRRVCSLQCAYWVYLSINCQRFLRSSSQTSSYIDYRSLSFLSFIFKLYFLLL